MEDVLYKKYGTYIKGKIHFSNSIKVFINDLLESSFKEVYYREAENALKEIVWTTIFIIFDIAIVVHKSIQILS